jgi:hypothetical protein
LVDAGVIIRRDSPNGKRYARRDRGGEVALAFGFDLGPLIARAEEFEVLAEEIRAEERALKLARERITICRRDIAKMIATGIEEGVPTRRGGQGPADWAELHAMYRRLVSRIPLAGCCYPLSCSRQQPQERLGPPDLIFVVRSPRQKIWRQAGRPAQRRLTLRLSGRFRLGVLDEGT